MIIIINYYIFKQMNKVKCKYNKKHIVNKEDYEKHLFECPDRNEDVEELVNNEIMDTLDEVATEKEQIAYSRKKYYNNCVEEPEIVGLGKKKQKNKKKKNKYFKEKFAKVKEKEKNLNDAIYKAERKDNDNDNNHEIQDFQGDDDFNLDDDDEKNCDKKEDEKEKDISQKKDSNNNEKKKKKWIAYDPNDED